MVVLIVLAELDPFDPELRIRASVGVLISSRTSRPSLSLDPSHGQRQRRFNVAVSWQHPAIGSGPGFYPAWSESRSVSSRPAVWLVVIPRALATSNRLPSPRIAARLITAPSSRIFPGQGYEIRELDILSRRRHWR